MPNSNTLEKRPPARMIGAVIAASRDRGEPEWLAGRRAEAARAFAALPMPTRALRPWRYTDLEGLDPAGFATADLEVSVDGAVPDGAYVGSLAQAAVSVSAVRERVAGVMDLHVEATHRRVVDEKPAERLVVVKLHHAP